MKADVVVVGGGIAGMSAAVRALEEGASVILLERANAERGGNTPQNRTGACVRLTRLAKTLKRVSRRMPRPTLTRR